MDLREEIRFEAIYYLIVMILESKLIVCKYHLEAAALERDAYQAGAEGTFERKDNDQTIYKVILGKKEIRKLQLQYQALLKQVKESKDDENPMKLDDINLEGFGPLDQ